MKRLLFIMVFIVAVPPLHSAEPLTAEELAYHLGIRSWVSHIRLNGVQYKIELLHVVNGKIVNTLLTTGASPTNRKLTRVAILATPSQNGTQLSIRVTSGAGGSGAGVAGRAETIPIGITIPLPTELATGDYVLGGDIPEKVLGEEEPPKAAMTDLKNGLLLRVMRGT